MSKKAVRIAVTGAAGQIGYALLFRIASGEMLGKNQPIILQLLEIPDKDVQKSLSGTLMELEDCAFPLLKEVSIHSNSNEAFKDAEIALLIGAQPRGPGMERRDLLKSNAKIFRNQGESLNEVANRNVKVLVVGNPANTNAYIAMKSAPDLPSEAFSAMLRLDHNRALSKLSMKVGKTIDEIDRMIVWGNHSPSMYPDYRFATVSGSRLLDILGNDIWNRNDFIPSVSSRGTEIIKIRGASSAASAANAIIDHMHDWIIGSNGKWITMGIPSDGSYGIPKEIIYGFPVISDGGVYSIVKNLEIDFFSREMLDLTLRELLDEREGIEEFLQKYNKHKISTAAL